MNTARYLLVIRGTWQEVQDILAKLGNITLVELAALQDKARSN